MKFEDINLAELTPREVDLSTTELKKGDIVKIKPEWLCEGEKDNFFIVMEASYYEDGNSIYLTSICDYNLKAKFPALEQTPLKCIQNIIYASVSKEEE